MRYFVKEKKRKEVPVRDDHDRQIHRDSFSDIVMEIDDERPLLDVGSWELGGGGQGKIG